jgi:3-oxoacyl-[acyl-carrier-protein] synthase II
MQTEHKVVITGGGVVSGLGIGIEPFWNGLINNKSAIVIKDEWNTPDLDCSTPIFFAPCADFKLGDYYKDLRPPLPLKYSQLAMVACRLALEDANINLSEIIPERIGLIMDTSFSSTAAAEEFLFKLYTDGPSRVSPFIFTKTTTNCALGDVARALKLKGPSSILLGENSACYGYDLIKDGKADLVVCGGFDEVRETTQLAHQQRGYLSRTEKNGQRISFEESLKYEEGIAVNGEGSSFVILESAEHAAKRNAKIYAEMVDYYITGDESYVDYLYQRSAVSMTQHLENFCKINAFHTEDIKLIVGASCLPWNIREYEKPAIESLWGNNKPKYTTIKGKTGETFSGSHMMALLTGALCMQNNKVAGTGYDSVQTGLEGFAPKDTIDYDFEEGSLAFVNTIHYGGNTVTIALKK